MKKLNEKIASWCNDIEDSAMQQINNLASLPFLFKHVAVMPDCHAGYGMPIGGVAAFKNCVVPNAVGVDIGCGMIAAKMDLRAEELSKDVLRKWMGEIRKIVPVGFNHFKNPVEDKLMPSVNYFKGGYIWNEEYDSAKYQMGTLGGGNHFIEIQKDSEGFVWVMIHSGSRNLGLKVAKYYNNLAIELNAKWHSSVPKNFELAFLPEGTEYFRDYIREMEYCLEFAKSSRLMMLNNVLSVCPIEKKYPKFIHDIHHNYASLENHYGENVWVHRKGATRVRSGEIGIIPGSQGSCSYIVKGLGNPLSFMSCSHGAGRKMSRTKAKENLNLEEEIKKMEEKGIIHGIRNEKDLDEAAGAYKDIDSVMDSQKDLIEIVTKLEPMAVVKG